MPSIRALRWTPLIWTIGLTTGCLDRVFEPPQTPAHNKEEDGFLHARDNENPFLCRDPETGQRGACPTDGIRPADENLSCDAVGCHGGNDFTVEGSAERHLYGSDGPSCYFCHEREWNLRTQ